MKIVLFISLCLLLLQTALMGPHHYYNMPEETIPFAKSFTETFGVSDFWVKIVWAPISKTPQENGNIPVGMCTEYQMTPYSNYIELDKEYWDKLGYFGREQILYHELSHCVLGREHDPAKFAVGLPKSIMYPMAIDELLYQAYRNYYIEETKTWMKNNGK